MGVDKVTLRTYCFKTIFSKQKISALKLSAIDPCRSQSYRLNRNVPDVVVNKLAQIFKMIVASKILCFLKLKKNIS